MDDSDFHRRSRKLAVGCGLAALCVGAATGGWLIGKSSLAERVSLAAPSDAGVKKDATSNAGRITPREGGAYPEVTTGDIARRVAQVGQLARQKRRAAYREIFAEFLNHDRSAALSWLSDNARQFAQVPDLLAGAGEALAANLDLRSFGVWARSFEAVSQRYLVEGYLNAMDFSNSGDVPAFFRGLNTWVQEQTVATLARRWASVDQRAAIEWAGAAEMSQDAHARAFGGIAAIMAEASPQDALEWAQNLPKAVSEQAFRVSLKQWIASGATGEVVSWVEKSSTGSRDDMVRYSFWAMLQSDPAAALKLSSLVQDPGLADSYGTRAFSHLFEEDRARAIQWLDASKSDSAYAQRVTSAVNLAAGNEGIRAERFLGYARTDEERRNLVIALGLALRRSSSKPSLAEIENTGLSHDEKQTILSFWGHP